jgi:hypothetical protein
MTSALTPQPPLEEEGLLLHRRLCDENGSRTATAEFADRYFPFLRGWLAERNSGIDPHLCDEAAGQALVSLFKNPHAYKPRRGGLTAYLKMAAQGDLINLLQREARHHRGRVPWECVELEAAAGNYLGRDEDEPGAADALLADVLAGMTAEERRVFDLMRQGERRTPAFAEVLGLGGRPAEEQEKEVKKVKDRIKARLKRAGVRR